MMPNHRYIISTTAKNMQFKFQRVQPVSGRWGLGVGDYILQGKSLHMARELFHRGMCKMSVTLLPSNLSCGRQIVSGVPPGSSFPDMD